MKNICGAWLLLLALSILLATPSLADSVHTCALEQIASLDMLTEPDGGFAIPVTLNDLQMSMLVDTGSTESSITDETRDQLGLATNPFITGGSFMNGVRPFGVTALNAIGIGPARSRNRWQISVIPNSMVPVGIAGMLGPDFMENYDIDLDFFHGKFGLFVANTCPAAPVYWTHDPYAVLSIVGDNEGHVATKALLDGKSVTVLFDTGSPISSMSLDRAKELFGLDDKDPRIKSMGFESINGGARTEIYSFPFGALDFNGITLNHPQIQLIPESNFIKASGDEPIILGMSVLRQMHIYIAYRQDKLYLTAAETSSATQPPTGTTNANSENTRQ